MIDTTTYLASIGILSTIIIAFVIISLKSIKKDYESKKRIIELQKQIDGLVAKDTASQIKTTELKTQNDELQKKIIPENKPNTAGTIRVVHFHDPDLDKIK